MRLGVCKDCGNVFDEEDMENGFCPGCPTTDSGEEAPELDMSRIVTDCE
jgi:predicted Zn-ribbon and HTH transcriptional regulator